MKSPCITLAKFLALERHKEYLLSNASVCSVLYYGVGHMRVRTHVEKKEMLFFFFLFFYLCVCVCMWYWDLNSGPTPWALHQSFLVKSFFKIGFHRNICPDWFWTSILLISASWVSRIIDTQIYIYPILVPARKRYC
jgi:hypothetical protein